MTYDVVIRVSNPELKLKPGMTANVSIIIATKRDVLKIPSAALRFKPSERTAVLPDRKGPGVWALDGGALKRVPISLGISDENSTDSSRETCARAKN